MEQSALGLSYTSTRRLTPSEAGTHVGIYLSEPRETSAEEVRQMLQSAMDQGYTGLESYIQQAITSGKVTLR